MKKLKPNRGINRRTLLRYSAASGAALAVGISAPAIAQQRTIKIGYVSPQTGPLAAFCRSARAKPRGWWAAAACSRTRVEDAAFRSSTTRRRSGCAPKSRRSSNAVSTSTRTTFAPSKTT